MLRYSRITVYEDETRSCRYYYTNHAGSINFDIIPEKHKQETNHEAYLDTISDKNSTKVNFWDLDNTIIQGHSQPENLLTRYRDDDRRHDFYTSLRINEEVRNAFLMALREQNTLNMICTFNSNYDLVLYYLVRLLYEVDQNLGHLSECVHQTPILIPQITDSRIPLHHTSRVPSRANKNHMISRALNTLSKKGFSKINEVVLIDDSKINRQDLAFLRVPDEYVCLNRQPINVFSRRCQHRRLGFWSDLHPPKHRCVIPPCNPGHFITY